MKYSVIEGIGREEERQEEARGKGSEKSELKDHVSRLKKYARSKTEQNWILRKCDWAISQQRLSLKPLIGDVIISFVKKATAVMNQMNHLLIASSTRGNSARVATPSEAASILRGDVRRLGTL
ncbi:MAG: hypothetical protein Q9184_006662 [Pyrenodesmia sp. 2 TL-2023]